MRQPLVIATRNRGKLREYRALLSDLPLEILGLSDVMPEDFDIPEDGVTFEANAEKKARTVAEETFLPALGDDSGLEVDALFGKPGVRSRRFAHDKATDAENNAALLLALAPLAEAGETRFPARFRTALALVDPYSGPEATRVDGRVLGTITRSSRGAEGFGYDPLFVPDGLTKTMAELSLEEKNQMSHRARALEKLRPALALLLDGREKALRWAGRPSR